MRWFNRGRRAGSSRFPDDMLDRLELLGRFEADHFGSAIDSSGIWPKCVAPFWEDSQRDRDAFLADLRGLVAGDTGGYATYGAARLVWELLGAEGLKLPAALPLVDAGIEFKRARGLPTGSLTSYERERWQQTHGPGTW